MIMSMDLSTHLLCQFFSSDLLLLCNTSLWLVSHNTTTPVFSDLKNTINTYFIFTHIYIQVNNTKFVILNIFLALETSFTKSMLLNDFEFFILIHVFLNVLLYFLFPVQDEGKRNLFSIKKTCTWGQKKGY